MENMEIKEIFYINLYPWLGMEFTAC